MSDRPLVSIFMPTFNHLPFIDEAIGGALGQNYEPLEIVIPDDCSTDGTADRVRELAREYPDIIVPILGTKRLGITGNCNRGLERCRGDFVAFTAGDDILLPGKIEAQVRWFARDPQRTLCGHDAEMFLSETGESLGLYSARFPLVEGRGSGLLIRRGVLFCGTTLMARRAALPAAGYDERVTTVSDWKFFVDVLASGGEFGYTPGVFARYRRHVNSATNDESSDAATIAGFLDDRLRAIRHMRAEHPAYASDLDDAYASAYMSGAKTMLWIGETAQARRLLRPAVRARPSRCIWALVLVLASFAPASVLDVARRVIARLRRTSRAESAETSRA